MLTIEQVMAYTGPDAPQLADHDALMAWATAAEQYLISQAREGGHYGPTTHGALFLLCGYGGGSLMRTKAFRAAILPVPDMPTLHLHVMGDALADEDLPIGRHADDAFALACALSLGTPMAGLNQMVRGWDGWNRWVATVAFAISAEQIKLLVPSVVRAQREERVKAEWQAWDRIQKGTATEDDHILHAHAMARAATGALL